jgi:hypothetical protein
MIKLRPLFLASALAVAAVARGADSPTQILREVYATYAALGSYADRGVILREYGAATAPALERYAFATEFQRTPRHFLFDFRKTQGDRYVIWGDPGAFHTWWRTTGISTDFPNPNNVPALNLSDFPTVGSATKIPALLYPKAPIVGALANFADPKLEATEQIDGHPCYRLVGRASDRYGQTGREVNLRRLTLWVDTHSRLIRQIREQPQTGAGQFSRTTTTFDPIANPKLDESRFRFTPPEPH